MRASTSPGPRRCSRSSPQWLEMLGWLVIDVYWSDLGRPELLVDKIEDLYRRRCREVADERAHMGALILDFRHDSAVES